MTEKKNGSQSQKLRNRRDVLKAAGLGVGVLAMPHAAPAAKAPASKRPNVLVIHVDELRFDCLGAYGNRDVKTPHVDALARDGVRFANSFCPLPVCTPSRYSLLSGLYVHEHRGWSNRCTLAPEIPTFPKILRKAGYKTAAVGKMHFLPTYLDVGFSEMALAEQDGPGRWDDDWHRYLMKNDLVDVNDLEDQRGEYRRGASREYWDTVGAMVSNLPEKHHATTWIADRAMEKLAPWSDKGGGLLMVGFIKPHHPFDPPAPWHEMYDPAKLTLLGGWRDKCFDHDVKVSRGYFPHKDLTEKKIRRAMAYYYATISKIDHHVGQMVALLKTKGIYDETLIIFTADHGDYMGFHHMMLKGGLMYDPLAKVPLIVKFPRGARAGEVSQRLVNNVDVAPTICRIAGLKPGARMTGQDLSVAAAGPKTVFAEHANGRQIMARTHTRKLIVLFDRARRKRTNFLYDLEKDPTEMTNLAGHPAYKKDLDELTRAADAWRHKGPSPTYVNAAAPRIDQPNVPPADLRHREAIIQYCARKMQAARK